jgi:hypothetical protein
MKISPISPVLSFKLLEGTGAGTNIAGIDGIAPPALGGGSNDGISDFVGVIEPPLLKVSTYLYSKSQ